MQKQLQYEYKPYQMSLPVNYEHIIDSSDEVVSFMEVVGGLNLKKYIKTSKKGRQEYEAEMMLNCVLFGFMENIRSLRQLEKTCKNDVRFMYLTKGLKPSFMAFQRFIDNKLKSSIDEILTDINKFLIDREKIKTEILYIDGTKLEANANKFSFVWKKAVLNYQAKLFLKISRELKEINTILGVNYSVKDSYSSDEIQVVVDELISIIDKEAIQLVYGKGVRKTTVQRHYDKIVEFQTKLAVYEYHLEICGSRNSYSKSDHDATFMHGKEDYYNKVGIFKPYYNVQLGVSDEYILHCDVFHNPTDTKTYQPFMDGYYDRYSNYPKYPVCDAGYGSYDNYLYNLNKGMELCQKYNSYSNEKTTKFEKNEFHIKNMSIEHNKLVSKSGIEYDYSHEYTSRKGQFPQHKMVYVCSDYTEEMKLAGIPRTRSRDVVLLELQNEAKKLLDSDLGIQLKVQRSIQVEGAFGEIKSNLGITRVTRRGKERVQLELKLIVIGYNLKKYHSKKHRILH